MQKQVKMEYSVESVQGIATFSEKQINALTFGAGIVRLRDDLIYVIPRQWVHAEKLLRPFNGHETSNKVFIIGIAPMTKAVASVTTLSINSLSASYYGDVDEQPGMRITAVVNKQGLHRAPSGTSLHSVFDNGGITFLEQDKKVYVAHTMAFTVGKRHQVYTGAFKNIGTPTNAQWDMETFEHDGQTYLKLVQTSMNRYSETVVPTFEWTEEAVGDSYNHVEKFTQDLPE